MSELSDWFDRFQEITPDLAEVIPSPGVFPVQEIPKSWWLNGAIVRMPNHIGDAMMALPALKQLREIIPPECGLFVIVPEGQRQIYSELPLVNAIIGLKKLHSGWSLATRKEIFKLRAGVGVLFNNSLRDTISLRLCAVPHLYGAAARGRSLLLTRSFAFPPHQRAGKLAREPLARRYLAIVQALGAPAWDGNLPPFQPWCANDELRPLTIELCAHPRLLLLAAGAAYGAAKRWSAENFNLVARHWVRQGGIVVSLGAPNEAAIGDETLRGIPSDKGFNLCGKTEFSELIQLMLHARMIVANDSGLMHLGAVLGASGVAVFGPTDPTATAPLSARWRLLFTRQHCAPCFARCCPKNNPVCMQKITPHQVLRTMKKLERAYPTVAGNSTLA